MLADRLHPRRPTAAFAIKPESSWLLPAALAIVIAVAFAFNFWVIDPRSFFYADDWGWLGHAQFQPTIWIAELWPRMIYNSRPVGAALITGLYAVVGLDHQAFHWIWLLIHCLNTALLLLLLWRLLPPSRAVAAAITAGCWHVTLGAVGWVAAGFDLVGATWCLLALLCYREAVREGICGKLAMLGAALCYAAAVRSKEFGLALIALLAAYDLLFLQANDFRQRLLRLSSSIAVFVILGARYLWLYRHAPLVVGDPYTPDIAPLSIVSTFVFYLQQLSYSAAAPSVWVVAVFAGFLLHGILARNRLVLFGLLGFVALLSAVLILPAHRGPLYLYAPHFFLSATLLAVAPRSRIATFVSIAVVALLLWWPIHTQMLRYERNYILRNGDYSRQLFEDYRRIGIGDAAFLRVDRAYFSPFQFGGDAEYRARIEYGARTAARASMPGRQGSSINVLRRDADIRVVADENMQPLLRAFCAWHGTTAQLLDETRGRLVDRSAWAREQCRAP